MYSKGKLTNKTKKKYHLQWPSQLDEYIRKSWNGKFPWGEKLPRTIEGKIKINF
jgi:hypothetical protein